MTCSLRGWAISAAAVSAASPATSLVAATAAAAAAPPPTEPQSSDWFPARPYSKAAAKQKGKKGAAPPAAEALAEEGTSSFDVAETQKLMFRAVDHLQHELANIRTGRATPGMLDHLRLDLYGEKMPLKACGTVSVRDAQLLVVTVFDPSAVPSVKKAIEDSALQLVPRAEGQEVLVPIPRPTAETLQAMMKVCKQQAEQAKVTVRHGRQQALQEVKRIASEDQRKRVEREVQKLTDEIVASIDRLVQEKERSIREHSS